MRPSVEDSAKSAPQPVPGAPRVCFDHACFSYGGAAENVLTDVCLDAMPGETIGVIGGTGAGKSALVNLIPRFYDATAGCVRIDGVDVRDYPLADLRARVGMVPQQAVLFRGTIRENMRWGARRPRTRTSGARSPSRRPGTLSKSAKAASTPSSSRAAATSPAASASA